MDIGMAVTPDMIGKEFSKRVGEVDAIKTPRKYHTIDERYVCQHAML